MEQYRIGDVAKVRNGYAFLSDDFQDTGVPVIRMSDLDNFVVDTKMQLESPIDFLLSWMNLELKKAI